MKTIERAINALCVLKFNFKNNNLKCYIYVIIFQFLKLFLFGISFMLICLTFNVSYYQMSISDKERFYMLLNYIILSKYISS
jgi:hypothetical protein